MSKPKIILIGAGGHCRSCIDVIELEGRFDILGIVDQSETDEVSSVLNYPLIGTDDDLPQLRQECAAACVTVGQIKSPAVRIRLFEQLRENGFDLPTIISPRAYVSSHATVGAGTMVMHDVLVNAGASVGENCILNSKALVEHDAVVGSHCHISTGAIVNGGVCVGAGTFFGSNAVSVQGVSIPASGFVRAGHLVIPGEYSNGKAGS